MRRPSPIPFRAFLLLAAPTLALAISASGCGSHPSGGDADAATGFDAALPDAEVPSPDAAVEADARVEPGPTGFIGSPCDDVTDCTYENAACVTEGFPGGVCTQACDLYCPDQDGFPTTFCVAASELPPAGAALGDGACLSRCDFGLFPETGCRPDYGCAPAERANEPGTVRYTCLPGEEMQLTPCLQELVDRGASFEPAAWTDEHPSTNPELTCHIEEPVYLNSPVLGVTLQDSGGTETPRILAACQMAVAVVRTVEDVKPEGVVAVRHMGTYNCRVIAGTSTLSQHAFANAIDFAGFEFDTGDLWTVLDHWEHDTATPVTPAGIFLYDATRRWFAQYFWNIILTPNYNVDHDNHFHVDLTPGSHYLGFTGSPNPWAALFGGRYLGPAPYAD